MKIDNKKLLKIFFIVLCIIFLIILIIVISKKQRPIDKEDMIIYGGWITPYHLSNKWIPRMTGKKSRFITDMFLGFLYTESESPVEGEKSINDTVINFAKEYKEANPDGKIWIIPFRKWNDFMTMDTLLKIVRSSNGNRIAQIAKQRFGEKGLEIEGFSMDLERTEFSGQIQPTDGEVITRLLKQLQTVNPKYKLCANMRAYDECMDTNLYKKVIDNGGKMYCSNGPSTISYRDFLDMDGAYISVQTYGNSGSGKSGCGLGCGPGNYGPKGFDGGDCCTFEIMENSEWQRLGFTAKNMCEHIEKYNNNGKDFLGALTPKQRRKVSITTYPTSPKLLQSFFNNVIFPFNMGGYIAFDIVYIRDLDESVINQFIDTIKNIQNKIDKIDRKPDYSYCETLQEGKFPCQCTPRGSCDDWSTKPIGSTC